MKISKIPGLGRFGIFVDDLKIEDLNPDYSGIRPKLFYTSNNFSDFYINEESKNGYDNLINLIGIDSPGLTASLEIGEYVNSILPWNDPWDS